MISQLMIDVLIAARLAMLAGVTLPAEPPRLPEAALSKPAPMKAKRSGGRPVVLRIPVVWTVPSERNAR